ncbi:MAG: CsgG/HfaB family protein [Verrucomicrobiae bacterium]|nr:CsgG/HfaB family protein [Verrucomicrobiae bacterium]
MILLAALALPAQTNGPVWLALIAESADAGGPADLLTAELSSHTNLQLLERNEIERVYREQGMSAGNKDYLKLGQVLGADGLLLIEMVKGDGNPILNLRLVATKPGVVLFTEKISWSPANMSGWSSALAEHLDQLTPKLAVLVKDAIPISVVNLRSATTSVEARETERQLKLLVIQRLSQERQIFVLERQRMDFLEEEKRLKLDDSTFWNGSYLLEGVVDQNGHSQETVTINARLTPPKGGAPVLIEAAGSRTNLTEVINQLAAEVNAALKISTTAPEWKAQDEAAQYFDEAKWALRWGVVPEAETAADSAWALGKRDVECALVRVRAYVSEVGQHFMTIHHAATTLSPGYTVDGKPLGPPPDDGAVDASLKEIIAEHPLMITHHVEEKNRGKSIYYDYLTEQPDPQQIDRALHALELYHQFCWPRRMARQRYSRAERVGTTGTTRIGTNWASMI